MKSQKMESKGHPTLKIKLKKSSCIFPIDNRGASKSVDKEVRSSPPLSARFNKATKISCPPKFLKHFIRKKTYFNNVWTALFVSETFGACSFKAQVKHYQGHHSFKSSFTEANPQLLEVLSSLVRVIGCNTRPGSFNSLQKCEQNTSKVQYGIANPKEDGSLEDQDSDVESVSSVSCEELEEIEAGEEVEDSEFLENIISDVCELFVEDGVEEKQTSLHRFREETPQHLHDIIEACGISFLLSSLNFIFSIESSLGCDSASKVLLE